jgi:hypothetical protein
MTGGYALIVAPAAQAPVRAEANSAVDINSFLMLVAPMGPDRQAQRGKVLHKPDVSGFHF